MAADQSRTDPRITRTRARVLSAALGELAEKGYGEFTIDGVGRRCGVARSTIYRLWTDRAGLIADAMEELNVQPPARPEVESPRDRVVAVVSHLADAMRGSLASACLPALIDGAERDHRLRVLHHGYADRRRAALVAAVAACRDSGQVGRHIDPQLAAQALAGAVFYRRLMTDRPLARREVERLVTTVLGPPHDAAPTEAL